MVGDWSPTIGGSVVGSVENIPEGALGDGAGSVAEPPQASAASRAKSARCQLQESLGYS